MNRERELLKKQLKSNTARYERNYLKLVKYVDTPEQKKYSKIEERLNRRDIFLRRELGVYVANPCPTQALKSCRDCVGWYKNNPNFVKNVKNLRRWIETEKEDKEAIHCAMAVK